MSGVAGADRIKSRQDFQQFLKDYKELISQFPGFVSMNTSGSYNSDPSKNDFGDIDLIVHIKSDKDKATVKKELQSFFMGQPETVVVPFTSEKHAGKRTYNAGELVSIRYHDDELGYSAQIDNIVAMDESEASFKQQFLDLPAEKQGLILGLVKIATIETDPQALFKSLGINAPVLTQPNEEYEFNLSSVEIQLRKVTYKPGTFEQVSREVIWTSRDFEDLKKILYQYDINADFDTLLARSKQVIKNPRSNNRMQGVFGSMITVKSGEVGTAKGAGKEAALGKIKQTFGESRLLREMIKPLPTTVVFAFGRFQPPTIGHELLIDTVKDTAANNGADYVIYASKTQDSKTNPLDITQKMHYLDMMFPGTRFVAADANVRTFMEAAKELNKKYKNLIMVAGSDRVQAFETTLNQYNGVDYNYDSIQVISAGERDPDSDSAAGMSATKMREAAIAGDLKSFMSGLPGTMQATAAEQLMADIQQGLKKASTPKKAAPIAEGNRPHRNIAKNNIKDADKLIEHIRSLRNWMAVEGVTADFEINDVKKLCSRILYPTNLTEDLADDRLKFIDQLSKLDQYHSLNIKVGSKVAILNAMVTGNYVELWGFTTPKRISKITVDRNDNIKQFEFNDDPTDVYPRADLASYNGDEINHSAFFGDSKSANHAISHLGLVFSDNFMIRNHVKENVNMKSKEITPVDESILESTSLESTLKSILTNSTYIVQVYETLKSMAQKWANNNGNLKGFHRNAAGVGSRWFEQFYFNKLQKELYDLSKQAPRYSAELVNFLKSASEGRKQSFTTISETLPGILQSMAVRMDNPELERFAVNWDRRRADYLHYLNELVDEDDNVPSKSTQPKTNVVGQQNTQVEQIINDVLATLPKNVAGEVRNAIARSGNKLAALKQELDKRGISLGESRGHKVVAAKLADIERRKEPQAQKSPAQIRAEKEKKDAEVKEGWKSAVAGAALAAGVAGAMVAGNPLTIGDTTFQQSSGPDSRAEIETSKIITHNGKKYMVWKGEGPKPRNRAWFYKEIKPKQDSNPSNLGFDKEKWKKPTELEPTDLWVNESGDSVAEAKQRLDAKCWKGKKKQGTKMKGGIRVNNCVPVDENAEIAMSVLIKLLESK